MPLQLSCFDHYQSGARISGVYTIDRGSGPFDIYCDMTNAGAGWDLVSVFLSSAVVFGNQRCTSLSVSADATRLSLWLCVCVVLWLFVWVDVGGKRLLLGVWLLEPAPVYVGCKGK